MTAQGERAVGLGTRAAEEAGRDAVRDALGALSTLVPIGIFAADANGSCWYVNQRLIDFLEIEIRSRDDRPLRLEMSGARPTLYLTRQLGSNTAANTSDDTQVTDFESPVALPVRVMPLTRSDGGAPDYLGLVIDAADEGERTRMLHPSERLLETLVERSPEVMTVLEPDGRWRYSNSAAWRLLGYQSDFEPADGVFSLLHPDDLPAALEALTRAQEGEDLSSERIESRVRAVDGSWHSLETIIENLVDDPAVHGLLLRSRDVTETRTARRELTAANERLSALIRSLHLAVLLEDADRTVVLTNDAFINLFEVPFTPDDLIGRSIASLASEFFRRFGDPTAGAGWAGSPAVEELMTGGHPAIGERVDLHDGRVLERDYVPVVVNGVSGGHLWLFRDISAQAHAEAEWGSLIEAQRRENRRLVELDQIKAAFLAEISHELRTPLTSILSFAELLTDGLGHDDPTEQAEFLDIIRRNADRLIRLVDDLLLLDRIETGAMPLEWGVVDVTTLVSSCAAAFVPAAEAKSISLEARAGSGPAVPGDTDRLAQVLDVLLSNALKFTPEHGRVVVRAAPIERMWRVEVIDNGIGVPAAEMGSIFERFYRGTNARISRIPGSGLGLSVARAICELHGGSMSLRSAEGTGTTVSFTIPYERSVLDPAGSRTPGRRRSYV